MSSEIFARHVWLWPLVWQSTLCLAAGLAGSFLLRRRAVRAHQVLLLGLVSAVLIPALSQIVKQNQWGLLVAERAVATPERQSVAAPTEFAIPNEPITTEPANVPQLTGVREAAPAPANTRFDWTRAVLPAWLALSSVLLLRLAIQFLLGRRLTKRSEAVEDLQLLHMIEAAKGKLGIQAEVRVRASAQARSPVIWCWSRQPVLLVPPESGSDTGLDWPSIVCHELAHAKRRDHVSGLLAELMLCVLPWQPLLWWARQRLAALSEECCDDWVIACGQRASGYARTLLGLLPQSQAAFLPGVVTSRQGLAGRVRRIIEDGCANPRPGLRWTLGIAAFATCVSLGLALAQTRPAARNPETRSTPARTGAPTQEKPADGRAKIPLSLPDPNGQSAVFSGRILRSNGGPVAGATVTLYDPFVGRAPFETRILAETTSADDGSYRLFVSLGDGLERQERTDNLPSGTVVVQKDGLSISWASWRDMRRSDQRNITLTEPKELAGAVVDMHGQPVGGATVAVLAGQVERRPSEIEYLYPATARRLLTATTDAAGKFTLRGLPQEGKFELVAKKTAYGPAHTWKPERPPERGLLLVPGRMDIRMVIPPEGRIEGKVVQKDSGKPMGGVEVAAIDRRTSGLLRPSPVRSGDDGAFAIGGLLTDYYVLRLVEPREQAADWVAPPTARAVRAGEVQQDVRIELSKGGLAEIAVMDACEPTPVPGVVVRVRSVADREIHQSVTKENGVAQIRLVPGDYELQDLTKRGYVRSGRREPFTIQEGRTEHLACALRPLATVSGVVRDDAGRPLPGAVVRVHPMGAEQVLADARGRFRITWDPNGWPPKATNYLVALDRQHHLAFVERTVKDRSQVELTLRPTATFVGQVIDINNRGIRGAEIQVMLRGPTWGSRLFRSDTLRTDGQGRFEFHTIPPKQRYHVTITADGYGRTDTDIESNDVIVGRVDLGTLRLAAANLGVSGIVVGPNGKPVPDAGVYTVAGIHTGQRDLNTRTDDEGRFRLKGLCAGPVHLQAAARIEGADWYRNFDTEGGATDVRIVLDRSN